MSMKPWHAAAIAQAQIIGNADIYLRKTSDDTATEINTVVPFIMADEYSASARYGSHFQVLFWFSDKTGGSTRVQLLEGLLRVSAEALEMLEWEFVEAEDLK